MAIYLKKFENHTQYETYTASTEFITPNVSLCEQENEVHYNPYVPIDPYAGHDYVDLGLPSGTKWATMNVGATSITDYGNYYQYGKGADTHQTTSGQSNYSGTENPLAASADTAVQVWGGQWHMPTSAQCQELIDSTTYEWVTDYQGSGINGGTFTANGKTLFIPAAGCYNYGEPMMYGANCMCLSSTPDGNDSYYLSLNSGGAHVYNMNSRSDGDSIRPVVG